jgi:hypothetical protein
VSPRPKAPETSTGLGWEGNPQWLAVLAVLACYFRLSLICVPAREINLEKGIKTARTARIVSGPRRSTGHATLQTRLYGHRRASKFAGGRSPGPRGRLGGHLGVEQVSNTRKLRGRRSPPCDWGCGRPAEAERSCLCGRVHVLCHVCHDDHHRYMVMMASVGMVSTTTPR